MAPEARVTRRTILFLTAPDTPHSARWIQHLRRNHDVHVGTIHAVPEWAAGFTTSLRTDGDVTRPGAPRDLLRAVPALKRLVARVRPDVTVAYYLTSYGLMAALAGAPRIVGATAGGDVLVDAFDPRVRRVRNRLILAVTCRKLVRALAWAPHVAERLAELGVPRDRILVQPRGVDLSRFRAADKVAQDPPHVVSLRWFKPLYDLPTLVRALGRLKEAGVPFRATLVGDGPARAELEALVESLGLAAHVSLPGTVPAESIVDILAHTDVYVSTSTTDGASASLFEAMAVGVYPVVSDIPANRPWIEPGRTGALFPVGDDAALFEALRTALSDPDARRDVIRLNQERARRELDFDANMERIERVIVDAASS